MKRVWILLVPALLAAGCGGAAVESPAKSGEAAAVAYDPQAHTAEIEEWRAARDERLRSENGWLSLVGLHWLEAGPNRFGSGENNEVVLAGDVPPVAGTFVLQDGEVRLEPGPDAGLLVDGEPATTMVVKPDASGEPNVFDLGELNFYLIQRADRFGLRVKNPNSPLRTGFTGIEHFDVDPSYRVLADFAPHDTPKKLRIQTVIGTVEEMESPGVATFDIGGERVSLEPVSAGDQYWYIFRDGTSGKETYGAGRYLYGDAALDGKVVIDFNKAYNPPCVFTPYATCPLPPRENWIAARVEAGEKMYDVH